MRALWTAVGGFVWVLSFALQTKAEESTNEDFKAFCQVMKGRFVGQVTWVTNWPGFGKKGDKVTAYWEGKLIEDDHVLSGRFFGGNGSETSLTFFCPASKQIKGVTVDSGGTVGEFSIVKKQGQWVQTGTSAKSNGAKGKEKGEKGEKGDSLLFFL